MSLSETSLEWLMEHPLVDQLEIQMEHKFPSYCNRHPCCLPFCEIPALVCDEVPQKFLENQELALPLSYQLSSFVAAVVALVTPDALQLLGCISMKPPLTNAKIFSTYC